MNKLTAEKCREFISVFKSLEKEGHLALTSAYHLQALEIALPILEQQERGEGEWLHWNGERALPPVDSYSRVEVRLRNGEVIERQAQEFAWRNSPVKVGFDIIAYRIIPEQPTNQNGEQ